MSVIMIDVIIAVLSLESPGTALKLLSKVCCTSYNCISSYVDELKGPCFSVY